MTLDELDIAITGLNTQRDSQLALLQADTAAKDAAQITAGAAMDVPIAAALTAYGEAVEQHTEGEALREGALDDADGKIAAVGLLSSPPPNQADNIASIPP